MKVTNVEVYDLEESIKASKYPMSTDISKLNTNITKTVKSLAGCKKGTGHDSFLGGIRVNFDLQCTNKMWVQMLRYDYVDPVSSQSTMHRITQLDIGKQCNNYVWSSVIDKLKEETNKYNNLEDKNSDYAKELYLEILYNTPSGFELTARLATNYRSLKTIYSQRKNHKLPEWQEFCKWIESLPYAKELITYE